MLTLFSQPISVIYNASIFSTAFLFHVLTTLITFVAPLLITYRSQGFWQKVDSYREQPEIHFKHDLLLLLESSSNKVLGWSTFTHYNRFLKDGLRVPTITNYESDENLDGKLDSMNFDIRFPVVAAQDDDIQSVTLFLTLDVKLHHLSSLHMEGLIYHQATSGLSGNDGIAVTSDVNLVQKEPLNHKGRDKRFLIPTIADPGSVFPENFDFVTIMNEYGSRNVSVRLENTYQTWIRGSGPIDSFRILINLRFPEQTILYTPGFWQVIKWAWVQYCSALIVFIALFRCIKKYVFENQILPTITWYSTRSILSAKPKVLL